MEPIVYKPYGAYGFIAWVFMAPPVFLAFHSVVFFMVSALFFLPLAFLFLRIGKATLTITEEGIDLRHNIDRTDRFLPWDQLKYYRLANTMKGQDVILLSPIPIDPAITQMLLRRFYFTTSLWNNGVLIIPFSFWKNTDPMRKFIYSKTLHE